MALVEMARADGVRRLDELIGPRVVPDGRGWVSWTPGELTHAEVREMLVEAGAMSLDEPRVMTWVEWWRGRYAGNRCDDEAIRMESADIIARVGVEESADRYFLTVLALGWMTHLEVEAALAAERRAIREELRGELRLGQEDEEAS